MRCWREGELVRHGLHSTLHSPLFLCLQSAFSIAPPAPTLFKSSALPPPCWIAPPPPPSTPRPFLFGLRLADAVPDVCGTPCRDVVDASGVGVCAVTWAQGCGDAPPPDGFAPSSTVGQMCARACAFYNLQRAGAGA
jgi:hypothetical protein